MSTDVKKILNKTCISTTLLCEFFGVSRQTVSDWEKKGCPKVTRGYWCMADILAWRDAQNRDEYRGEGVENLPLTMQKTYWETRCREEQAENQKFKNAILRGDYLEKIQVERELAGYHVILKQAVLSLPRKSAIVTAQYIGNERARKLENDLMEVMIDALSQWSQNRFDATVDFECSPDAKTPGKNNRKPMGGRKQGARRKK